jgi:hypothetical protein
MELGSRGEYFMPIIYSEEEVIERYKKHHVLGVEGSGVHGKYRGNTHEEHQHWLEGCIFEMKWIMMPITTKEALDYMYRLVELEDIHGWDDAKLFIIYDEAIKPLMNARRLAVGCCSVHIYQLPGCPIEGMIALDSKRAQLLVHEVLHPDYVKHYNYQYPM